MKTEIINPENPIMSFWVITSIFFPKVIRIVDSRESKETLEAARPIFFLAIKTGFEVFLYLIRLEMESQREQKV